MDEYIVVKALENGVNIIGLTSGKDTKVSSYGET